MESCLKQQQNKQQQRQNSRNTESTRVPTLYKDLLIFPGKNSEYLAYVPCLGYKTFMPGTRIQLSCPFPTYQALLLSHKSWLWASSPEKVTPCFSQALRDALVTHVVMGRVLGPHPASWASLDSQ